MPEIDTDKFSVALREKSIDVSAKKVLITRLAGSEQEQDISEPTNCTGFGRVRHFKRQTTAGWPENPLPIDPACFRLGIKPADMLRAQVFQNAVCNWRCWYCYVPFSLLAGNLKHSAWFTAAELVDLYLQIEDPPQMLDISGGQPDLTPEWVLWMMRELEVRGLQEKVYLLFVFCGPIGSGKSSVSKLFAQQIGARWNSFGSAAREIAGERSVPIISC